MRVMRAGSFGSYEGLRLNEVPKPTGSDGKVLVRVTAAGVVPLDHTISLGECPGESSACARQ